MQISEIVVKGSYTTLQSMPLLSGVLQGSVLGPLLFNGITSIPTSSDTQTVLYEDDLLLFHPISQQ